MVSVSIMEFGILPHRARHNFRGVRRMISVRLATLLGMRVLHGPLLSHVQLGRARSTTIEISICIFTAPWRCVGRRRQTKTHQLPEDPSELNPADGLQNVLHQQAGQLGEDSHPLPACNTASQAIGGRWRFWGTTEASSRKSAFASMLVWRTKRMATMGVRIARIEQVVRQQCLILKLPS